MLLKAFRSHRTVLFPNRACTTPVHPDIDERPKFAIGRCFDDSTIRGVLSDLACLQEREVLWTSAGHARCDAAEDQSGIVLSAQLPLSRPVWTGVTTRQA